MQQTFDILTKIIRKNDKILIMTHENPDFDGLGSAIGIQQIINSFEKESYIICNKTEQNETLKKINQYSKKIYFNTISKSKAIDLISEQPLLIILDTHKQEMLEIPELVDKLDNIVIIDHHVKNKKYIKNSVLNYINVNLSSTVEFVANYIKYLNKKIDPIIATFMLAGLEIDTNKYKLKTTEQTHETAAILLKMGADNTLKHKLLQESIDMYIERQKLIEKSKMINENMVMCIVDNKIYTTKDLATIAEELLQFENVSASFVIGKLGTNKVGISSRSIGNINVEKIMSSMGGGGHINEAATQIENKTIKEVEQILIENIGG